MSYGLQIINDLGGISIDDQLPQAQLVTSGSAPSAASNPTVFPGSWGGLVTFPRAITNPIIYLRSAINALFHIGRISSTSFEYVSSSPIDYRVYEGAALQSAPSGYGLAVYNAAGAPIYDSNFGIPLIYQESEAVGTPTDPTQIPRNITFSLQAADGGLPFVSAATLQPVFYRVGNGFWVLYNVGGTFTSASQLAISAPISFQYGVPAGSTLYKVGQHPRNIYFIK